LIEHQLADTLYRGFYRQLFTKPGAKQWLSENPEFLSLEVMKELGIAR
jgi:hypothetical protein